jgi:enoyl-CoA hydratase/carnithine racemase
MIEAVGALREARESVAVVTFNRPKRLNAINIYRREMLTQAVEERHRAGKRPGLDGSRPKPL